MESVIKGKMRLCATWCAVFVAGSAHQVWAQQLNDPASQEIVRQQQRERVLREQQEARPDVRLERAPDDGIERLPETEAPCFQIERIVLDGPGAEEFRWVLKSADPRACYEL